MPNCDVCGDPIRWGLLPGRRWVALDHDPSPAGRYVLLRDDERIMWLPDEAMIRHLADPEVQARRFTDHHRTCPLRGMLHVNSAPRRRRYLRNGAKV